MRRRLIAALVGVATACASIQHPPGGPPRHEPPEVIAINPDSAETNVRRRNVQITFDEVVRDQTIGKDNNFNRLVLISPEVGSLDVSWHKSYIVVKGHEAFRPNTSYRITVLPGITDLHGNTTKTAVSSLFSTGGTFDSLAIHGQVWDWESGKIAKGVTVLATKHLSAKDSITYVAMTDSLGLFELGPLSPGAYSVLAFIDQNKKGALERTDKWDRQDTTVVASFSPKLNMLVIERDSAAPRIGLVNPVAFPKDSVSIRVDFNEFLDPLIQLQTALVRVQLADSTELKVDSVRWLEQDNASRTAAAKAAAARRDSTSATPPPAVPIPAAPVLGAPGAPGGAAAAAGAQPKAPKPPPSKSIVLYLSPSTPLQPGMTYRVTVREGFRNLRQASQSSSLGFRVPKLPPTKPPPPPSQ